MESSELETWFIDGQILVEPKEAARYLGVKHATLLSYIVDGKLPVVQLESRQFIELETLKAFAEKRKPKASAWDKLDEWRGK